MTTQTPPAEKAFSTERSEKLFERAQKVLPGGVNSPVRSCKAVGANPVFIAKGDGSQIWDADGNQYVDYCGSWGAHILGHKYPRVQEALEYALLDGTSFGAPTKGEVEFAELLTQLVPSVEVLRMVSSGTEACMSALRLARAYTGKQMVIKFDGCYHGHADSFLVKAGSGLATLGIGSSPGVPEELSKLTLSLPYNDLSVVEKAFKEYKDQIAAVIVEPIAANAGLILPEEDFLPGLRDLCTKYGALLIFDEVITGFRVALGGAQAKYNVKPDLSCFGKIVGGGLPVGVYGGKREIMDNVAPVGKMYQAGTLSGNPLAVAAGLAQMRTLQVLNPYPVLEAKAKQLAEAISEIAKKAKHQVQVVHTTGLVCVFFTKGAVRDFATAQNSDCEKFAAFWRALLKAGVYWPPAQFEAAFVSYVHTQEDMDRTLAAMEQAFAAI
jgi:glutamate-1-semialdehyde 2,1-aminomutase